ncbi:MAG: CDGSH iron-sulfur domain-containing protein [Bacteroidales bacterium]|nr:CDGSH iron-sulfur domain-containing protein [Bacteroidales bacterium]
MEESKPIVVDKHSMKLIMEPGTYFWCACGRSKKQPFCDGSHKDFPPLKPVKVEIKEKGLVKWCLCKYSKTPPFCDNFHREL